MACDLLDCFGGAIVRHREIHISKRRPKSAKQMKNLFSIISPDFTLNETDRQEIRACASGLGRFFDRVTGCDVVVEASRSQSNRRGDAFGVHIRVSMPGDEMVVSHHAKRELRAVIKEAFDATGRCLKDYARVMRTETKSHCQS